jgi:hypothetical protein
VGFFTSFSSLGCQIHSECVSAPPITGAWTEKGVCMRQRVSRESSYR